MRCPEVKLSRSAEPEDIYCQQRIRNLAVPVNNNLLRAAPLPRAARMPGRGYTRTQHKRLPTSSSFKYKGLGRKLAQIRRVSHVQLVSEVRGSRCCKPGAGRDVSSLRVRHHCKVLGTFHVYLGRKLQSSTSAGWPRLLANPTYTRGRKLLQSRGDAHPLEEDTSCACDLHVTCQDACLPGRSLRLEGRRLQARCKAVECLLEGLSGLPLRGCSWMRVQSNIASWCPAVSSGCFCPISPNAFLRVSCICLMAYRLHTNPCCWHRGHLVNDDNHTTNGRENMSVCKRSVADRLKLALLQ